MARLPIPGSDDGTWGGILNDFLSVEHNADGSLKSSGSLSDKVSKAGDEMTGPLTLAADPIENLQAATKSYVDTSIGAGAPDATTSSKGIIQLSGDLDGTADSPTVPGLATKADDAAVLHITSNLGDLDDAATARSNLGLGDAALLGTAVGGDLSGSLPDPTVSAVNGIAVSGTPTSDQVLTATGSTTASWKNSQTNIRSSPTVVQFASAQVNWNSSTTVHLSSTPTAGNVLVAIFGACNQPGQPPLSWFAPSSGWLDIGGNGGQTNIRRRIEWGIRAVQSGDTTSISVGSYGDVSGSGSGGGASVVVYEVSGADMSNFPSSAIADSEVEYDATSGNPTCGFATTPVDVPLGGLVLAGAAFVGSNPVAGPGASPSPSGIDVSITNAGGLLLATYHADASGLTSATSEIDGPVANSGNVSTIELLVLLQGPRTVPGKVNEVVAGAGVTVDATDPSRPVVSSSASNFRASPVVVQFASAQISWNANTTVTLNTTPTVGNLLVAIFGGVNQPGDPALSWYAPSSNWQDISGNGGQTNVKRRIEWGIRAVQSGDTTSVSVGSFGDQTGSGAGSGASVIVYEVHGADMSTLPTSAIADSAVQYDGASGDPTCGFPTDPLDVPGGGLVLAAAAFTGSSPVVGTGASPTPTGIDISITNAGGLLLASYNVNAGGVLSATSEIDGTVANSGNVGTIELIVLLQGPRTSPGSLAAITAGPGIAVDNSTPSRPVVSYKGLDSRLNLAALGGGTPFYQTWITIGQETDPWVPNLYGGNTSWTAGDDLSLDSDGIHIKVGAVDVTLMVRVAMQISPHLCTKGFIAPIHATGGSLDGSSGFTGLLGGDGDPLSFAITPGSGDDLISTYLWRVSAGSSFCISMMVENGGGPEFLDGAEIDIVRIA